MDSASAMTRPERSFSARARAFSPWRASSSQTKLARCASTAARSPQPALQGIARAAGQTRHGFLLGMAQPPRSLAHSGERSLRGCCGWMARGVPTRGVLASPGTAAACAGRPMGVGWEQRSRCIVKKGARPGREVRIRGAAACGGLQSGRASGDQAGSGLHGWASRSSGERSEVNRSHAATNRAAIAGPMTKPVSPNSAMPPRVEISTR